MQVGKALTYCTELKRFVWKTEEKVAFARRSACFLLYGCRDLCWTRGGRGRVGTWGFVTEMLVFNCTGLPKATA